MAGFHVSIGDMLNILVIAAGIGICGMNILQVSTGVQLPREVKRYFQVFFSVVILYIGMHLARMLMDGRPGSGIRIALGIVTFTEVLMAGIMAYLISRLILFAANPGEQEKKFRIMLIALLCIHVLLLITDIFCHLFYYFDENNVYHRAPAYLLSNLCPLVMLAVDAILLIRYGKSMNRRVRKAFWIYIIAPIAASLIQSFFYGIQFIIFATVGAAVYMSIVIMQEQTEKYEQEHENATRMGTELRMATDIQASQLPSLFPAFPNRPEFDVFASMTPAKEVGGDFYDFFLIDDDHIGLVMADVSGKGVPAALYMMASRIIISNHAMMGKSPAQVLSDANTSLCENGSEDMFVTVWIGILELSTGKLTAANGGHEYPVLMKDGCFELYNDEHGLVIGGIPGMTYENYEIQLKPGDKLFVYTDGVPEANNRERKLFGIDRMLQALNRNPDASPEEVLSNVMENINAFVAGAEQFDDITMLCLKYNGTGGQESAKT